MLKRPYLIAFTSVLLVVVAGFCLPRNTSSQIKLALGNFFTPLLGLVHTTETVVSKARDSIIPRSVLLSQMRELLAQNQELTLHMMQSTQLWQENQRLREALDWAPKAPWTLKPATVILRDPASWWRTIQIDLGTESTPEYIRVGSHENRQVGCGVKRHRVEIPAHHGKRTQTDSSLRRLAARVI